MAEGWRQNRMSSTADNRAVAAGIVTYNPELELLKKNIQAVLPQVELLIVVDNHSDCIRQIQELLLSFDRPIVLIQNEENMGIAKALNQIMDYAQRQQNGWVLTLDQDSIIPSGMVAELLAHAQANVAIVCPTIRDRNAHMDFGPDKISPEQCITSGSLTNVAIWKRVGGFDEKMFIDEVDFDYNYRVLKAGYRIYQDSHVILDHAFGAAKQIRIFNRSFAITNYSPTRKYYTTRNKIYNCYKNDQPFAKAFFVIGRRTIGVLLFEKQKGEKLKAILKGIHDGISMGRSLRK